MKKLWFLVIVLSFMVMVPCVAHADGVTPTVVTLIAGGGGKEKGAIDVGYVTVTNDADNVLVTYTTTSPWCMTATNLQVATSVDGIPQTKKGNPEPGQFQYQTTADPCVLTVQYPISLQDTGAAVGQTLDIAAYAQVMNGDTGAYEGAWGAGTAFSGKNWDTYFTYTVQNPVVSKIIFVTSEVYQGDLGGLAGADAKCQYLADNAGLPGTYKAWLSDDTTSAADRLTHFDGPYVLTNGVTVADNWTDLSASDLQHSINKDESGGTVSNGSFVWTGSNTDNPLVGFDYCNNWTDADNSIYGDVGIILSVDDYIYPIDWTYNGNGYCSEAIHLYCIQQ